VTSRALGTPCKLYIDLAEGEEMESGDFVVTSAGTSAYEVQTARLVNSSIHPNRWTMRCIRFDPVLIPEDANVVILSWYDRSPR
jgi:hypothetical protein